MNRRVPLSLLPALSLALLTGCRHSAPVARTWSPDSIPEAYSRSVAALMWPGATRAYQVTADGDLFNGSWMVRIAPSADGQLAGAPKAIAYEDRWCPVVRWTRRGDGVRWEFEAVAAPEDAPGPLASRGAYARWQARGGQESDRRIVAASFSGISENRLDSLLLHVRRPIELDPVDRANLFVSVEVTVHNDGDTPKRVSLDFTCEPYPVPPPFSAPDSQLAIPWRTCWSAPSLRDPVIGRGDGRVRGATLANVWTLAPGEARHARVLLPAYPTSAGEMERRAHEPHAAFVAATRNYWYDEMNRGASFELGDPAVEDAMRAARVLLLSLRERRTTDWVPIGGPFHYRDVWLRDGARAMQALALCGYTEESRALATSLLRFQWPHGPFLSQAGQMDGSGQAMWAFEQTMLRPAPAPDVWRFAESSMLAWRAIERLRRLPSRGNTGGMPGMLPSTDPNDAEMVRAQLVGNDAWAIAGYRAAYRLLRAARMNAEADTVARSLMEYQRSFQAALAATGRSDVPPSWRGDGADWGNLAVGFPCRALPAADPHLDVLAHRYWRPAGGAGIGYYRNADSLHSYVAADLGTWALVAGERAVADSVLDAALWWRSASGGAAEVFTRSGRNYGINFPPHPTAAAALVALVRNSLLYDDGDTLQVTLGARDSWWRGAHVKRAPTRWGLIDLAFERQGATAIWRWTKVPVWTALTLPPGMRAGELTPPLRPSLRPDVVLAPPGTSTARVQCVPVASAESISATSGS